MVERYPGDVAKRAFYAGLVFFVLSLIILGGKFFSGDAEAYFTVGFNLSTGQLPAISERLAGYGVRGTAGLLYAKFGLGFSLVLVPFIWSTLGLALLSGSVLTGPVLYVSSHLAGPVIGGVGIYLFHTLQARLNFDRPARTAGTVFFIFGGLWLVYSRFLFSEPLAGVLLLVMAHAILTDAVSGDWLLASSGAFLCLIRLEMVLIAGPLMVIRLFKTKRFMPYVTMFVLSLSVFGWYNWLRFGQPFYTGMGHSAVETFSTPILLGFYGQFFAVGNGLFLYAPYLGPPVLVGFVLIYRQKADFNWYLFAWGTGGLAYLLVHSAWHSWMGGWSWGPRRIIPLLGVMHLSIGYCWGQFSIGLKSLMWTLLPLSILANTAGLAGDFNQYYQGLFYTRDVLFNVYQAQVVGHNLGLLTGAYHLENVWLDLLGPIGGLFLIGALLLGSVMLLREFYRVA